LLFHKLVKALLILLLKNFFAIYLVSSSITHSIDFSIVLGVRLFS